MCSCGEVECFGIGLGGTAVAEDAHAGFGERIHTHLSTAMDALAQEHHGTRFRDFGFRELHGLLLAEARHVAAEKDFAVVTLNDFAGDAALEATPLAVAHAGNKAVLRQVRTVPERFPLLQVAVKVGDVVPHDFCLGIAEHAAEAVVTRKDAAVFVHLEARHVELVFEIGHNAPPIKYRYNTSSAVIGKTPKRTLSNFTLAFPPPNVTR